MQAVPLYKELGDLTESIYRRDSLNFAQVQQMLAQAYASTGDLAGSLPYMKEALRIYLLLLPADHKDIAEATAFVQIIGDQLNKEGAERQALEQRLKQKKGPKVPGAAGKDTLRARMAQSVGASPVASGSGTRIGGPVLNAAAEAAPVAPVKEHGQKANLSVDELVNFIQGKPSSASSKATGKSTSASRKRKVSPPAAA